MKPADWPRYMVDRQLSTGVSYYWVAPPRDRKNGFQTRSEALGSDYGKAIRKAKIINAQLDSWRAGEISEHAPIGSVRWWLTEFKKTRHFKQNSPTHRANTRVKIDRLCDFKLPRGRAGIETFGQMTLSMCTPLFADRFYELLHPGRERQGEIEVALLRKAWSTVRRDHPDEFPNGSNPFEGITLVKRRTATKAAASREQAYALAGALSEIGHPHLGAAALICFEWHQRPENVLSGAIRWSDYRPGANVTIDHWKTGVSGELPLSDDDGLLFPEIEEFLAHLPQLGLPIVLTARAPHKPYPKKTASDAVRRARRHAGLPENVTLDACRHGGLTELGDAELTESQEMALSGHKSVVLRGYIKKTEKQRQLGARKRTNARTKTVQKSK